MLDKVQGQGSAFRLDLSKKVYTMNNEKQESLMLALGHVLFLNQIGSYLPADASLPLFDCFLAICPVKEDVNEMKNSLFYQEMSALRDVLTILQEATAKSQSCLMLAQNLAATTAAINSVAIQQALVETVGAAPGVLALVVGAAEDKLAGQSLTVDVADRVIECEHGV